MLRLKLLTILLAILLMLSIVGLNAQNMGIKLSAGSLPNAVLDVNGSVAMREGSPLSIANGANNNVAIDSMSYYRITAPTAVFTITGFANGQNGQILILYNATSYTMTLGNQTTSSTANQINTCTGSNLTISSGGLVTLRYNSTLAKWICTASMGASTITNWALTGNNSTVAGTNYLGTSDAQDLVFKTNNVETMRLSSSGKVGINVPSPNTRVDIDGGLTTRTAPTVTVTANNQTVTVSNKSFLRLSSNGNSSSRNIYLTDGLQNGQIAMFHISVPGSEGVKFQNTGNCRLSGNIAEYQGGSVWLIWDNGFWYELFDSNN